MNRVERRHMQRVAKGFNPAARPMKPRDQFGNVIDTKSRPLRVVS